jgi:hypothetical protein
MDMSTYFANNSEKHKELLRKGYFPIGDITQGQTEISIPVNLLQGRQDEFGGCEVKVLNMAELSPLRKPEEKSFRVYAKEC